ncbi:hypothetical protein SUSAZ_05590 [Sulfolobus acidocaldarius SUSAZ]|nr:hypothetical protein SUSAZ_05590 [Sulfolobus acidocaldarius SUSAZ]
MLENRLRELSDEIIKERFKGVKAENGGKRR